MKSLIRLEEVSYTYPGRDISALENIGFEIFEQDLIACLGPNGAGKTTLVKIILGLLNSGSGNIIRSLKFSEIGYTPQRYYIGKNFPGTVGEILSLGGKIGEPSFNYEYERGKEIFSDLEFLLGKKFINLSGGEQQRVLIALSLKRHPRLLILDEPTAGVDATSRYSFYHLLEELNRKGIAILLVTHEMHLPLAVNRVLYLDRFSQAGSPDELKPILAQSGIDLQFSS